MADFLIRRSNLRDTSWAKSAATPLPEGKVRLKVDAFALTANNVTYATFGEAMGYWNFFPTEDQSFGRVPVWGFATVTESKAEGISPGARVYGYLPISEQFDLSPVRITTSSFMEGGAHRQGLSPFYNTYTFTSADPAYHPDYEAQQMLFRPLFMTGWMIDDCLMEASETPPETVVISSASSKTAIALAHCLSQRAGVEAIGLTSTSNQAYVESTGLYARTVLYEAADSLQTRGLTAYVDFVGRPALTADIHHALKDRLSRSLTIGATDWETSRAPVDIPGPQPEFFFVPTYAAQRAKELGPDIVNKRSGQALKDFYSASQAYLTPHYASGQTEIQSAWQATLDAQVAPSKGLILSF